MAAHPLTSKTMKSQVEALEKDQTKSEKRSRSLGRYHQLHSTETFSSMARRSSSIGGNAESRKPPSLPSSRETSPTGRGRGMYHQPMNKTARVRSVSRTRNSEIEERNELRGRYVSRRDESEKENARSASVPPRISKKFKGSQEFYSAFRDNEFLDALEIDHEEEKTIRAVYAQMKSNKIDDTSAVVKESENLGKQKNSDDIVEAFAEITNIFASKLGKAEKHKRYLMVKLAIEQQHNQDLATIIQVLLPYTEPCKTKPSTIRKRNGERKQMSEYLNKEAQNYFEQFVADFMTDDSELPIAEVNDYDKKPELQPARGSLPETQLINEANCIDHIQLYEQSNVEVNVSELSTAKVDDSAKKPAWVSQPETQLLNEANCIDHIQPVDQSSAQREQMPELQNKEAWDSYKELKAQLTKESSCLDDTQIVEQSSAQREQMSECLNKEAQKPFVADSIADGSELLTTEVNDNVEKPELQSAGDSPPGAQLINEARCIDHIQLVRSAAEMSNDFSLPWLEWETSLDTCMEDTMTVNNAPLSNSNAIERVFLANNYKLDQGLPPITTEENNTPSGGIGSFLRDLFIVIVLLTV